MEKLKREDDSEVEEGEAGKELYKEEKGIKDIGKNKQDDEGMETGEGK